MNELEGLNPLDVYKANSMLLSGRPTKPVDALFFHGRGFGDYTGLFELTKDLVEARLVRRILLFGNEGERVGSSVPYEVNSGKTWCRQQLLEHGIDNEIILDMPPGGYHTKWESDDFVKFCAQNRWTSGVILTQPHQLLRATLGMIVSMEQQKYGMEVYTASPTNTPWQEVVKGSQGRGGEKPRIGHIADELIRIPRYQRKGDLASFPELFGYLELRERGLLRLGNLGGIPQGLHDLQPDRLLVNFYSI